VRRLARDLENQGIHYWLDEAKMKVGDSLIKKIREGIDRIDYFVVVLSENSIEAPWVVNELDVAMNHQINGKNIKVLPLMLEECDPPGFLLGKLYADFKNEDKYESSFKLLVNSMGVVFNKTALDSKKSECNLGTAIDKAYSFSLSLMSKPFHRPYQYMGMSVQQAEVAVGMLSNKVGNILVENDACRMLLEAEGNFISYIEVDLKETAPHRQDIEFDSEPILGSLSIGLTELELARKKIHYHTYYDHRKKIKVSVSCPYDGGPLTVGFSSKYYGL